MPCDVSAKPLPDPADNRWMMAALCVLWVFTVYNITIRLWETAPLHLALFLVAAVIYFGLMSNRAAAYYRPRRYRGYFLHQFLALTVMLYGAQTAANFVWTLFLPVLSQVIMYLPPKRMPAILLANLFLAAFPALLIPPRYAQNYLISFGSSFLFTAGCSYAIRREFTARRQLHDAHEQLRAQAAQAEALATAEERNRLAREIHDGVAHHLTSANVLLEAGLALLPPATPPNATDSLQKSAQQIRAALGELRDSIASRQPAHDTPLPERLEKLIHDGNFPATLALAGPSRRFAPAHEQALYRVAQEALTNARKHAPGHSIRLALDFSSSSAVSLRIENDQPAQSSSGDGAFGLLSLRERMQQLGGTFRAGAENPGKFVVLAELSA
jgi:signal transduction histidine kinase